MAESLARLVSNVKIPLAISLALCGIRSVSAETVSLDPRSAVYQSAGISQSSPTTDWDLNANGYVGTFITLNTAADVTVTVSAKASSSTGPAPIMDLSLAGQNTPVTVSNTAGFQNYTETVHLNPGTYNFDAQFNNFQTAGLQLNNFTFSTPTTSGLALDNPSGATRTANLITAAGNASDSYIANYRQSPTTMTLLGNNGLHVAPGTQVHIVYNGQQTNPTFNWGTAVFGGSSASSVSWTNGTDSNDTIYRNFLLNNFNDVEPENSGKWQLDEPTQGNITMGAVDAITQFAQQHGMNVRMHNLIWASQQPTFVNNLLADAATNPTDKAALSQDITNRIGYYVAQRATTFQQLDVLNEGMTGGSGPSNYWNIYGASGIASIYNQVNQALAANGGNAKIYTNEYNVLQFGGNAYATYYLNEINQLNAAGGPGTVSGVGIEYYPLSGFGNPNDPNDIGRIYGTLQNLSITHLPISLTEFGVQSTNNPTQQQIATILENAMRVIFGTPDTNTFQVWEFMQGHIGFTPLSYLIDSNGNLTPAGEVWQQMLGIHNWDLAGVPFWGMDTTLTADANGQINFNGFEGDYTLSYDGQNSNVFVNGPGPFLATVPEPSTALIALSGIACLLLRRRGPRAVACPA